MIPALKKALSFTDIKSPFFNSVTFSPGEVVTQDGVCAARQVVDLDLDCSVSAKALQQALKVFGEEPKFELFKGKLELSHGKTVVKLPLLSAPQVVVRPTKVTWKKVTTLQQAKRVLWSVSKDISVAHMTGVALTENGIEGLNGHVLSTISTNEYQHLKEKLVVPVKLIKNLPAGSEHYISKQGDRIFVTSDPDKGEWVSAFLLEGDFPDTANIAPAATVMAQVNREELLSTVKHVALSTEVLVATMGKDSLSLKTSQGRDGVNTLFDFAGSVALTDSSLEPFEFGMNAHYLQNILENCTSESVTMSMTDGLSPLVIRDTDYIGVALPMRL